MGDNSSPNLSLAFAQQASQKYSSTNATGQHTYHPGIIIPRSLAHAGQFTSYRPSTSQFGAQARSQAGPSGVQRPQRLTGSTTKMLGSLPVAAMLHHPMDDIVVARMASQLLLDAGHPAFTSFAKIKSEIPEDMCEMNLVDRYRQITRGSQSSSQPAARPHTSQGLSNSTAPLSPSPSPTTTRSQPSALSYANAHSTSPYAPAQGVRNLTAGRGQARPDAPSKLHPDPGSTPGPGPVYLPLDSTPTGLLRTGSSSSSTRSSHSSHSSRSPMPPNRLPHPGPSARTPRGRPRGEPHPSHTPGAVTRRSALPQADPDPAALVGEGGMASNRTAAVASAAGTQLPRDPPPLPAMPAMPSEGGQGQEPGSRAGSSRAASLPPMVTGLETSRALLQQGSMGQGQGLKEGQGPREGQGLREGQGEQQAPLSPAEHHQGVVGDSCVGQDWEVQPAARPHQPHPALPPTPHEPPDSLQSNPTIADPRAPPWHPSAAHSSSSNTEAWVAGHVARSAPPGPLPAHSRQGQAMQQPQPQQQLSWAVASNKGMGRPRTGPVGAPLAGWSNSFGDYYDISTGIWAQLPFSGPIAEEEKPSWHRASRWHSRRLARRVLQLWWQVYCHRRHVKAQRWCQASRHSTRSLLARGIHGLRMALQAREHSTAQGRRAWQHHRRSHLRKGLHSWLLGLERQYKKLRQLRRAQRHATRACLRRGLNQWRWVWEAAARAADQQDLAVAHMAFEWWRRRAFLAWQRWWRDAVDKRRATAQALRHHARYALAKGFAVWTAEVARAQRERRILARCLARRTYSIRSKVFFAWRGVRHQSYVRACEEKVADLHRELTIAVGWSD